MKRIISVLVAVFMLASLCTMYAFAYDVDANSGNGTFEGADAANFSGSNSAEVQIQIDGNINHRYAVDITFNAPVFTLSTGATWNPETHEYEHTQPIVWNGTGTVVVTNHSDLAIVFSAESRVTTEEYGPLSIVFNGTSDTSVAETTIDGCPVNPTEIPKKDFTYGVTGSPTVATIEIPAKLGEVIVTVKPAA